MALLNLDYKLHQTAGQHKHLMLSLKELQRFNSGMLDLGSGTGRDELIFFLKKEVEALPAEDRDFIKELQRS